GVLNGISPRNAWRICLGLLNRWNFKATRFDVAIDDFDKSLSFDTLQETIKSGDYSRFKSWRVMQSSENNRSGWTVYCGSHQSDKVTRIYDKEAESKGKIKSIRFETQLRNEIANQAFREFAGIVGDQFEELGPTFLGSIVTGAIDFVRRESGDRLERRERLPWWQGLVDRFGQIRFAIVRPIQTAERKLDWVSRQVAPTLAVLHLGLGSSDFNSLMRNWIYSGRDRLIPRQETMAKQMRLERSLSLDTSESVSGTMSLWCT
ncbi:MAG TPA: replication initiation factor domain-containing protein, partial [Candidatus Caenarcaniphilales bacterium]